jgi:branched-subunit amino acid aminotransferase/4-amino-4-deoxychorismate lyase
MSIKCFRLSSDTLILINSPASTLDLFTASVSDGFYSTFSTLNGGTRVLGLTAHLQRLYKPALEKKLKPSASEKDLRIQIAKLAKENLPNESRIRIILTKDTGDIYIAIQPFEPLSDSVYQHGVHVITSNIRRHDPRIKGTDFITQSQEQRKLLNKDVFEILLTKNGKVLEGMTSNFYIVKNRWSSSPERSLRRAYRDQQEIASDKEQERPRNDILITAQRGILLGVTRKVILKLAKEQGMAIEYRSPILNENFNEAFLTSSSRGVVPIVSIDNRSVGQGSRRAEPVEAVGKWTEKLMSAYQKYVLEKSELIIS